MGATDPDVSSIFPDEPLMYATFSARFWAAVVDGVFVFLAMFLVVQFTGSSEFGGAINLLIMLLYHPLMEGSKRQATLGKTAMNIKVADLNGGRVEMRVAFGRHLSKLFSMAILCVGYLMMLWSDKRQTLHDRMAGTLVVKI